MQLANKIISTQKPKLQLKNQYSFLNYQPPQQSIKGLSLSLDGLQKQYKNKLPIINKKQTSHSTHNNHNFSKLQSFFRKDILDEKPNSRKSITRKKIIQIPMHIPVPVPIYQYIPFQQQTNPYQEIYQHQYHPQVFPQQNNYNNSVNLYESDNHMYESSQSKEGTKKWRKYVYVVFFCLYFKSYSSKFGEIKKNKSKEHKGTLQLIDIMAKKIEKIDMFVIGSQCLDQEKTNILANWQEKVQAEKIENNEQSVQQLQSLTSQQIINSTLLFVDQFQDKVLKKMNPEDILDWSILTCNGSYTRDHEYFPEQARILTLSIPSQKLKISKQQQIYMLLIRIFCKTMIEQFTAVIIKDKEYNKEMKDKHNLEELDISKMHTLTKNIGYYLFKTYRQLLSDYVLKYGNTANMMKMVNDGQIQLIQQKNRKNQNLRQFHTNINKKEFQDFEYFWKNSDKLQEHRYTLVDRIMEICQVFWQKIQKQKKLHYQQIKQLVLNSKNLIKNYGAGGGSLRAIRDKRESIEGMSKGSSKDWNKQNNQRKKGSFRKLGSVDVISEQNSSNGNSYKKQLKKQNLIKQKFSKILDENKRL